MKEVHQYICPRCFITMKKSNIIRHFARKNPCVCKNETQLVLTDQIKSIVLQDRIYHIPKETKGPKNVNNTVNNFMNNYFSGPLDKIRALTEYRNTKMLTVDQTIDEKCFEKKQKYERNQNIYYNKLTIDDLLQILDDISNSSDPDYKDFNVLYDKKQNKMSYMEDDGRWKVSLVDKGLSMLLGKIKDNFLDYYECYLIRQIRLDNATDDLLKEYYKFLVVFHIEPITYSSDDSVILENDDYEVYTCKDEFYSLYTEIRLDIKISERMRIRRQMIDIIKRNSYTNEDRLSSDIHNIFAEEEDFKKFLLVWDKPS